MNFIQTLLIDGYISQTFQSKAAEQYFLDLLKSASIPPYATLYNVKRKDYRFFVHSASVPPHIPALFPNPPDRRLLDRGIMDWGTVVPQTMWSPLSSIDIRRHIERAELQIPVFFEDKDGRVGISLGACIDGQCRVLLRDPTGRAPLGQRSTTHVRIVWPGYKEFKRQIPLRDESRARNPITMAKFVDRVGRSVNAFLQLCELDSKSEDVRREQWRIGPDGIQRHDIMLIGAIHVSAGTWMPIMQLNRYIF
ncbi:hypothetical protein V8E53_002449 [Lactarius tabidus]